jgi:hypothetical protein
MGLHDFAADLDSMTILTIRRVLWSAGLCGALMFGAGPAAADKIKNPTAVFAGLDKITGRIISFEAAIDETVQFGSLQITPRVCYTRPPTEAPQTDVFAEVDEVGQNKDYKRIFTGWMFAASPGLHGIEHPVYDIWLTDCKGGTEVIHTPPQEAEVEDNPPPDAGSDGAQPGQAGANPATTPAQPAPPKKRKPPKPVDANIQPPPPQQQAPLDLNGASNGAVGPRGTPSQRFFPTDAPPVPPGNIPNVRQ